MSEITKIRCSSLPRLALCPGSMKACEGLESKSSKVSESGTRTHAAIEAHFLKTDAPDGIERRERLIADWFIRNAEALIESHGGAKDVYPELQMSGVIADGFEITGRPDLFVLCNDGKWLLFDWKAGFAEVQAAARNIQLMGYVWLLATNEFAPSGIEAYLFSAGSENALTGTNYDPWSFKALQQKLTDIVQSAVLRDVRNPGDEQCKYCQAKCSTRCPETLESLTMPPIVRECLLPANKDEAAALRRAAKSFIALAESYVERIDAEVRAYPDEWKDQFFMQSTGSTRTIKDVQKAYDVIVVREQLMDSDAFLALVTLPIGSLEKALKDKLTEKQIPAKDHKMHIADLLGDNLEPKEKQPSVKEVVK